VWPQRAPESRASIEGVKGAGARWGVPSLRLLAKGGLLAWLGGAASAVLSWSCDATTPSVDLTVGTGAAGSSPTDDGVPSGGGSPGEGGGGGFGADGGGGFGATTCAPPDHGADLAAEVLLDSLQPMYDGYYTWIVEDDEQALRDGGPLFDAAAAGQDDGPGDGAFAIDQLRAWAVGHPDGLEASVASVFEAPRVAWPHPWPIRFDHTGGDAGSRLLRLQLTDSAWIAKLATHGEIFQVYDLTGQSIALDVARETPEKIAVLFFIDLGEAGAGLCGSSDHVLEGLAYRQFLLGNRDFIQSYEIGTERILSDLMWDISALSQYLELSRACPSPSLQPFDGNVACNWGYQSDPYFDALATPSELYRPTPAHVADLIDTLEGSLFETDPWVSDE